MKKKSIVLSSEGDILVDLTFHNFSASLLAEFVKKIVKPYYGDNMNEALKNLVLKSIRDEEFFTSHLKSFERINHS